MTSADRRQMQDFRVRFPKFPVLPNVQARVHSTVGVAQPDDQFLQVFVHVVTTETSVDVHNHEWNPADQESAHHNCHSFSSLFLAFRKPLQTVPPSGSNRSVRLHRVRQFGRPVTFRRLRKLTGLRMQQTENLAVQNNDDQSGKKEAYNAAQYHVVHLVVQHTLVSVASRLQHVSGVKVLVTCHRKHSENRA